jgi:nucleotide-binding universal stress UspA family protein
MAAMLAEKVGATIDLLHVIELPVFLRPEVLVRGEDDRDQPLATLVEQQVREELRAAVDTLEESLKHRVTCYVFFADLVGGILAHAAEHGCDLIVIGSHGRSGVSRAVLGSVTQRVLRRAPLPVLVVPLPRSKTPHATAGAGSSEVQSA